MTHFPDTLLQIIPLSGRTGFQLPPFSARDCTQTLEQIVGVSATGGGTSIMGTQARVDINGNLVDLTIPAFRKYVTTITCRDIRSPSLDNAWLGENVEMLCAAELSYPSGGSPFRPPVSGSERTVGHWTFYRPILQVKITAIANAFEEWKRAYNWKIEAREL